jgi:hypothetical protein
MLGSLLGGKTMRRVRSAALLIAALGFVLWTAVPAFAQATDACDTLDAAVKANGLAYFTDRPTLFKPLLDGTSVVAGDPVAVTFQGAQIENIKDISKVCVKAFQADDVTQKIHTQVAITPAASGQPQQLEVTFVAPKPSNAFFSSTSKPTLVGVLTEPAQPIFFGYTAAIKTTPRMATMCEALAFVAFFYGLLAWWTYNRAEAGKLRGGAWLVYALSPVRITAGAFGDASLSQVQVVLFTFIVAGLLFQLWLRTGVLSDISVQLLMLLGISAVGAGGAKFTATIKSGLSEPTAKFLVGKGWSAWEPEPMYQHATFRELLLTDGRLDVYKFQMAIFTVVVAAYVISAGQSDLSDVKISETMLYLIGISQGVYVGGKAVTDRTTDLENAVAKMIDLDKQIQDLNKELGGVPRPANAADLTRQRADLLAQYRSAQAAAEEYAPLTHKVIPANGNYLQPAAVPPAAAIQDPGD